MNKKLYDLFWGFTLRTTTRGHRLLHRISSGRLGRRFPGGGQIIWVTTLGRTSGQWRTTPLLATAESGDWVVTGSNAGQAKVPGWVYNMRADPDGYCLVDDTAWTAHFIEVEGPERDALYAQLIETWKGYSMYADHAGRYIPVFRVRLAEQIGPTDIPR